MGMENSLHRAYEFIDGGNFQSAIDVLELLILTNPVNVEVWEAYMQICTSYGELDFLCERALQVAWTSRLDRESILDYYYFLRQRLAPSDVSVEFHKSVTLELVDQFNISLNEKPEHCRKFKYEITWFLGGIIVLPYIVLLVLGWNLLSIGDSFGYCILMVLMLSVYVGISKNKFPIDDSKGELSVYQSINSGIQNDEPEYFSELLC